jgi:hypothetical protein
MNGYNECLDEIANNDMNKPKSNCCNAEVHWGNDTDPDLPVNGTWCSKCHKRCGFSKDEKCNA